MKRAARVALVAILLAWGAAILMIGARQVSAATITWQGLCPGYAIMKRGNDLVVQCPVNRMEDWKVLKNAYPTLCAPAVATSKHGDLTITCKGKP